MASVEANTATVIETLMNEKGYTVHSLADQTGIPYNTLKRRVKTGRDLLLEELYLIAQTLEADVPELLIHASARDSGLVVIRA